MTLQPGCRLVVAPHFHLPVDWSQRLLLGAGVDEIDGHFFPEHRWRKPAPDELALLVQAADVPLAPEELEACMCLFQLPGHLRSEWWKLLEHNAAALGQGNFPGFTTFVNHVGEFLAFKSLPVPEDARCDVVVNDPAQPSAGQVGLRCSLSEEKSGPRLWGGINLGDEATSVVLINLTCGQMGAELQLRFPTRPSPTSVTELAAQFLRAFADDAPVRLILEPGEGYRLPRGGLIVDGYPRGKQETDVLLLISHPAGC